MGVEVVPSATRPFEFAETPPLAGSDSVTAGGTKNEPAEIGAMQMKLAPSVTPALFGLLLVETPSINA